jgi:hypothetical protein
VLWGLGGLAAIYVAGQMAMKSGPMDEKHRAMRNLIISVAKKYGVNPRYALAFAWIESRFDPMADGDVNWAKWDNGARYKKNVLENPKFADSPYKDNPALWHSYGLFQLLAPYYVEAKENPAVLYSPAINADRGVKRIATSLKKANGSIMQARVEYAGAANLPVYTQNKLKTVLAGALKLIPITVETA